MASPDAPALVVALDGLIRRFDPAAVTTVETRFGLPAGALTAAAHDPGPLRSAVTGQITDQAWHAGL